MGSEHPLFGHRRSRAWIRILRDLAEMAKRFADSYKGQLAERLGPAIRDYAEIEMLSGKITSYLFLRERTDLTNAAIKAKHAAFQRN